MADSKRKGAKRKDTNLKEDSIPDVTNGVSKLSLGTDQPEKDKGDGNEQHGNQTPDQNWVRQGARPKTTTNVSRKLFRFPESTKKPVEEKNTKGSPQETTDGTWLKSHVWEGKNPDREERMDVTVNMSKVYTVTGKWRTDKESKEVDLKKIYSKLPEFIKEMKVPSLRQEVQAQHKSPKAIDFKNKPTPYLQEIKDEVKHHFPTDKPSLRKGDKSFKAYSLQNPQQPEENYWYLDCEYMLTMHLPGDSLQWLDVYSDHEGRCIRAVNPWKKYKRWIFIPSFRRAKIALLDWPPDGIITPENTIRILVVRPSEFKEYVQECGHKFPIISLPQDEIEAGSLTARIPEIARCLKLDFIWIIKDRVECFYEYHSTKKGKGKDDKKNYRPCQFGKVFQQIENLMVKPEEKNDENPPFVATTPMEVSKPSDIATAFFNIPAKKSMGVYYRPEFQTKGDTNFKACSLWPRYCYLDCEYMLNMYLPDSSWFDDHDREGKRIRAVNPLKKDKRWIFIPSFRRAQIALLDWPPDEIITPENTIRILVVRPSEFKEYVEYCGHKFPIISLPQDEIGAGYPRFWIQKIALRLKLDFIWMIDDSVECFNEYHPTQKPSNYKDYRRRKFGLVFERIERLVKKTKDKDPPIVAMSPKRFMGGTAIKEPFVCTPPRIAVFLSIAALKSKDVYYRPELQALEDMIFGYECEQNGLKVFIDNRVQLQDHDWSDTGARSHSVQQKQT